MEGSTSNCRPSLAIYPSEAAQKLNDEALGVAIDSRLRHTTTRLQINPAFSTRINSRRTDRRRPTDRLKWRLESEWLPM